VANSLATPIGLEPTVVVAPLTGGAAR
jgi:hypothetical protein